MILQKFCSIGILALFSSLPLQGVGQAAGPSGEAASIGYRTISTDELAEKMREKDFKLINVHIPYEGEIQQTDAFVPFDSIANEIVGHVGDRAAPIVLYCMSGRMSEIAGEALVRAGYTNVSHVAGGMIDWKARGRLILRR